MGKGYANFMSKKAFHPGSNANQRRIREAEAQSEAKRKNDEEKLAQYLKEQELFNQRSLVSKQTKEKLSLNFMYEPPPGVEKQDDKQTDKVKWKGSSVASKPTSTTFLNGQSPSTGDTNICLEWKRERPVKKSEPETEKKPEIKQEGVNIKKEPKTEPDFDLKWKRDALKQPKTGSRLPDTRVKNEIGQPDRKRVKKERF